MLNQVLLLPKRDAATALGISLRKLDYLIAAKEIPVRRIGRRVLISRTSLEQFAHKGPRRPRGK